MRTMQPVMVALLAVSLGGCYGGTATDVIDSRKNSQQVFNEAMRALAGGDFATAKPLLDKAISSGYLHADSIGPAYVSRAICSAATGDFAAAHTDLDEMEQGAPNLDEIFAARSYVFEKEGKKKEAKSAWNIARRMNRYVKKITD